MGCKEMADVSRTHPVLPALKNAFMSEKMNSQQSLFPLSFSLHLKHEGEPLFVLDRAVHFSHGFARRYVVSRFSSPESNHCDEEPFDHCLKVWRVDAYTCGRGARFWGMECLCTRNYRANRAG